MPKQKKNQKPYVLRYLSWIPFFGQGYSDYLCGYYAGLMLRIGVLGEKEYKVYYNNGIEVEDKWVGAGMKEKDMKKFLSSLSVKKSGRDRSFCTIWNSVVSAIWDSRPSILVLPKSDMYPDGHYVVVKGAAMKNGNPKIEEKPEAKDKIEWLIVNDPLYGERMIHKEEIRITYDKPHAKGCAWIYKHKKIVFDKVDDDIESFTKALIPDD